MKLDAPAWGQDSGCSRALGRSGFTRGKGLLSAKEGCVVVTQVQTLERDDMEAVSKAWTHVRGNLRAGQHACTRGALR